MSEAEEDSHACADEYFLRKFRIELSPDGNENLKICLSSFRLESVFKAGFLRKFEMLSLHSPREGRVLIIFVIKGNQESLLRPLSQKLLGFMQRPVMFFSALTEAATEVVVPVDDSVVTVVEVVVVKTGV